MSYLYLPGGQKRDLASGEQSNGQQAKRARLNADSPEHDWQDLFGEDLEADDMVNDRSTPEPSLE